MKKFIPLLFFLSYSCTEECLDPSELGNMNSPDLERLNVDFEEYIEYEELYRSLLLVSTDVNDEWCVLITTAIDDEQLKGELNALNFYVRIYHNLPNPTTNPRLNIGAKESFQLVRGRAEMNGLYEGQISGEFRKIVKDTLLGFEEIGFDFFEADICWSIPMI